ncbi:hypothetical protein ACK36U_19055, partial [Aeromonas veronii]
EYKITPCSVGQILVPCLKNVRDLALLSRLGYNTSIKQIKAFYDYSIRNIDLDLPFNPNDKKISSPLLLESNKIVRDMYYACC